ncbi:MAG: LuxR C-terminal-related transcriptional regulator [Oscillospiraceae bacterium]
MTGANFSGRDMPGILPRPRIDALLRQCLHHPHTTVVAPVGWGKTTAVSAFVNKLRYPTVWLDLNSFSNQPEIFHEQLATALEPFPQIAETFSDIPFPFSCESCKMWMERISAAFPKTTRIIVVIDNFDQLEKGAVQESLFSAVQCNDEMKQLHFFLLSRKPFLTEDEGKSDDGMFWNTQNWVVEGRSRVTATDLSFDEEELFSLASLRQVKLKNAQLAPFLAQTAGWPLLADLILRRGKTSYTKLNRADQIRIENIFNQLAYQQLSQQDRRLLLELSLLPCFSVDIAALLSEHNPQDVFTLLSAHPFSRFDNQNRIFFFHPLYKDFLSGKSQVLSNAQKKHVHNVAGDWYYHSGFLEFAQDSYWRAENYQRALEVLMEQQAGPGRIDVPGAESQLQNLGKIPSRFAEEHPLTDLAVGAMLLRSLKTNKARKVLEALATRLEGEQGDDRDRLLGEAYALLAEADMLQADSACFCHIEKAASLLTSGSSIRSKTTFITDQIPALILHEGMTATETANAFYASAPNWEVVGRGSGYGFEFLLDACVSLNQGKLDKAESRCVQAIFKSMAMEQYDIAALSHYILARVELHRGDYVKIAEQLRIASELTELCGAPHLTQARDIAGSILYLLADVVPKIQPRVSRLETVLDNELPLWRAISLLEHSVYQMKRGDYSKAIAALSLLPPFFVQRKIWDVQLASNILLAICYFAEKQRDLAFDALHSACELAEPHGFSLPFSEYGNDLLPLLDAAAAQDEVPFHEDWLARLRQDAITFAWRAMKVANSFNEAHRAEPAQTTRLTMKELQVLNYLSQGLTREEISREMDISVNGVKKHLAGIYNKLGAKNRTDAVHIATVNGHI